MFSMFTLLFKSSDSISNWYPWTTIQLQETAVLKNIKIHYLIFVEVMGSITHASSLMVIEMWISLWPI